MNEEPNLDIAHLGHVEILTPKLDKVSVSSSMCSG